MEGLLSTGPTPSSLYCSQNLFYNERFYVNVVCISASRHIDMVGFDTFTKSTSNAQLSSVSPPPVRVSAAALCSTFSLDDLLNGFHLFPPPSADDKAADVGKTHGAKV